MKKNLWYVADPMCSWCWGFAPVIQKLREQYSDRLNFRLKMGGLRPYTKTPISPELRHDILHHWHNVQQMTAQPFQFEGALPDGFIYDTEKACRAVVSVMQITPQASFSYFFAIQQAFYAEQQNVTKAGVLASLAVDQGIVRPTFLKAYESENIKEKTYDHFQQVSSWGIKGFPSIVLQDQSGFHLLFNGYCSVHQALQQLDAWLRP